MNNILAILMSAAALAGMLGMIKKGWQTGTITIRFSAASIHFRRNNSPVAFWIAWCVEGLMALVFLGYLSLNVYLALHTPVNPGEARHIQNH